MFELLTKKVIEEIEERKQKEIKELQQDDNIYLLQYYLTDLRKNQLKNEEITKEEAIHIAIKRCIKQHEKQKENKIQYIKNVENAKNVNNINISVAWSKSRIWGMNPTAYVNTSIYGSTTGSASGCGYDKESSAIAEALNKNKGILKILYEAKEKYLKENYNISSHDSLGYGSGYGVLPYFEGGVGVGSLMNIFKNLGFQVIENHNKVSDFYYVECKGE